MDEAAGALFAVIGVDIRHGDVSAFYTIAPDFIQLPEPDSFTDSGAYAAPRVDPLDAPPLAPGSRVPETRGCRMVWPPPLAFFNKREDAQRTSWIG